MFYNIPIVTTSLVSLLVTIVAAVILALIPDVPNWLTALLLVVITLVSVVAILKSHFVAETVSKIDDKVKAKTFFIKNTFCLLFSSYFRVLSRCVYTIFILKG
jgi:membrane protein implicated in regulation of membrane protease activity